MNAKLCKILIITFLLKIQILGQSGGGENIPDVSKFKPVDMTDMVDLFTGDFSYSIPLLMIPSKNGSFPLTLSYSSGVVMGEEASSVGLGWALTPGAITRTVRAIPDDFSNTDYYNAYDFPDDYMYGLRIGAFSTNGRYNTGSNIMSGEVGISLNNLGIGINGNDRGGRLNYEGLNVSTRGLSVSANKEELQLSMSMMGASATISSIGNAQTGGWLGGMSAVSRPGAIINQQSIGTAAVMLQQSITSALTNGYSSWYMWFSRNKGDWEKGCFGSLKQNMNTSWLNPDYRGHEDYFDKVGFGYSAGHISSKGMANDAFVVFAQGLQGTMMLFNEPYQDNCFFRFLGDPGSDFNSPVDDSNKNSKYYQGKKIDYYENPALDRATGKVVSFVITKEDGVRYVFGQPVYAKYVKKGGECILGEDYVSKDDQMMMHYYKNSSNVENGYAIAWLLTAILYPDYQPSQAATLRENITPEKTETADGIRQDLIPDENSKGNWVKFIYGKKEKFYLTSQQYLNTKITDLYPDFEAYDGQGIGAEGDSRTKNIIAKEIYCLRAVETNTHTAVLNYSDNTRTDGYESYSSAISDISGTDKGKSKPAKLDEIALLNNADVMKPSGTVLWNTAFSYNVNNVINGWSFNYTQELCRGIPNSDNNGDNEITVADHISTTKNGKLTLKGIRQFGVGKRMYLPSYQFDYYNDGTWGKWKYDRWGTYKENGEKKYHIVDFGSAADYNAKQFNLKSIQLPTGGKIDIDYESKKYLRVGKYDLTKYSGTEPIKVVKIVKDNWTDKIYGDFGHDHCEPIHPGNSVNFSLLDYIKSPLDEIEVVVRMECTSTNDDNTSWKVQFNDDIKDCIKDGSYQIARYKVKATETDRMSVAGKVCNTSGIGLWYNVEVKVLSFVVSVIVHHNKGGTGLTETNPKCGGGPRVKKVTYHSMLGDKVEKNYLYQNWDDGNRESGVASLEPPTFSKSINDIVEDFTDLRNFYKSGPYVCNSHVIVQDASGNKRYKFITPHENNLDLVLEKDIPDHHKFKVNESTPNLQFFTLDGSLLGTMRMYTKTIPYVLVDKTSFIGKIISEEILSASNSVINLTEYKYKDGFDMPLAEDRTKYTRSVLEKDQTSITNKNNYFVHSLGPIHSIGTDEKNGMTGALFTTTRNAINSTLQEQLEYYQIYTSNISLNGDILSPGTYMIKFDDQEKATNYLFKYDVLPLVESINNTENGIDKTVTNTLWDAKSSKVLRTALKTPTLDYQIIEDEIPAYHKFVGMEANNMLEQNCQKTIYKNAVLPENAAQSNVTQWDNFKGTYLQSKNYVWNEILDNNAGRASLPVFPFATLNSIPTNWKLSNSFDRYDSFSHPVQVSDWKSVKNTSIFGKGNSLLSANVLNADFRACGVFTCDYDNNEGIYFDQFNGWEKGGAQIVQISSVDGLTRHFADKCLKLNNATGPTRNCMVIPGYDYIFSAWVNVKSGTLKMSANFMEYSGDLEEYPLDNSKLTSIFKPDPTPKSINVTSGWTYVEMPISTDKLSANNLFIRASIGNTTEEVAYIDDIRIYPKGAQVSSYYYHPVTQLLQVVVDQANTAKYFEYDDLGRLRVIRNNAYQKVKEHSYSLMNDGLILTNPKISDSYLAGNILPIQWKNENDRNVDIYIADNGGNNPEASWVKIHTEPPVAGKIDYTYEYSIPGTITTVSTNWGIKIQDVDDSKIYDISGPFAILISGIKTPKAGSLWNIGQIIPIDWTWCGVSTVDIYYSIDGGTSWTQIGDDVLMNNGKGQYDWIISSAPSENVKIKICDTVKGNCLESGVFSIRKVSFVRKSVFKLFKWTD